MESMKESRKYPEGIPGYIPKETPNQLSFMGEISEGIPGKIQKECTKDSLNES